MFMEDECGGCLIKEGKLTKTASNFCFDALTKAHRLISEVVGSSDGSSSVESS